MVEGRPWWQVRLRKRRYRATLGRKAIIEFLSRSWKHPSPEQIYLTVRRIYPRIGLTTVYRTLELLEHLGIIRKLVFGDGRSRYEISGGPRWRYHQHLFCVKCGKVIDYQNYIEEEEKLLNKIGKALSKKFSFKIDTHQLHFYGLCKKCR